MTKYTLQKFIFFIVVSLGLGIAAIYAVPALATSFGNDVDVTGKLTVGGSLGIGTTVPTEKLHVVSADSDLDMDTYVNGPSGEGSSVHLKRARGNMGAPAAVALNDKLGQLTFHGYDGTAFTYAAGIYGYVDGNVAVSSVPTRLQFFTTPVGGTAFVERMRIDRNGRVGIGTLTPGEKLHIVGGPVRLDGAIDTTFQDRTKSAIL